MQTKQGLNTGMIPLSTFEVVLNKQHFGGDYSEVTLLKH